MGLPQTLHAPSNTKRPPSPKRNNPPDPTAVSPSEYINSSLIPGWQTNASDYWNAAFFNTHWPRGAQNSYERRGLTAKEALARKGVAWQFFSIIEVWNSGDIPAYDGKYFIELCSDQARGPIARTQPHSPD